MPRLRQSGDIVLDGDPAVPTKRDTASHKFSAHMFKVDIIPWFYRSLAYLVQFSRSKFNQGQYFAW